MFINTTSDMLYSITIERHAEKVEKREENITIIYSVRVCYSIICNKRFISFNLENDHMHNIILNNNTI